MNRLAGEKSPYLLQHADNPVDWFPWSAEAFARARRLDKPIFLSIGYSTCHWCHVMERESFSDAEVAALMNAAFVSIKIDREERPDLDGHFMEVCQRLTGSGGWPLTIVMTPDARPFFAATYVPRAAAFGRMGMVELIPRIVQLWTDEREEVLASADSVAAALAHGEDAGLPGFVPTEAALAEAAGSLADLYDSRSGGFGGAPKFPMPSVFPLLFRLWQRTGDDRALNMAEETLRAMRNGGIFDQVGGGFHHYSTDGEWHVPHFEKMLYDQAQLALSYTEAARATGKPFYGQVAREVIGYVLRDLLLPGGGFASAEDADSEGEEGRFYLWTEGEIQTALGTAAAAFAGRYDLRVPRELPGAVLRRDPSDTASSGAEEETLRQVRDKRPRPLRDDKALADWNGLMIAALARSGSVLGEERFVAAARAAADFVLERLRSEDGRLLHRYRDGEAAIPGFADDHAFLAWGLLELYEATFEEHFLDGSLALTDTMIGHFWDGADGGFFQTADDSTGTVARRKSFTDGVLPSANSVGLLLLLRLGRLTGRLAYQELAERLVRRFPPDASRNALAFSYFLRAVDFFAGPTWEIVVVGDPAAGDTQSMLRALRDRAPANAVILLRPADEAAAAHIVSMAPFTKPHGSLGGRPTAYICRDFRCSRPVTGIDDALALLAGDDTRPGDLVH